MRSPQKDQVTSHGSEAVAPSRTPPKAQRPNPTTTAADASSPTPSQGTKRRHSTISTASSSPAAAVATTTPVTAGPVDNNATPTTTSAVSGAKSAAPRSKSASAAVTTRLARATLKPARSAATTTHRTASAAARTRRGSVLGAASASATTTGGVGAETGGAASTVAVVPYLRPAGTPIVHVRIRPLLPYMGETVEQRKTWFLDAENLIVRPQPRNVHTATSSLTSLTASAASPIIPSLSLSGAAAAASTASTTTAVTAAGAGGNAGNNGGGRSPRKGLLRGSGTTPPTTTVPSQATSLSNTRTALDAELAAASREDADGTAASSSPLPIATLGSSSSTTTTAATATFGNAGELHYRFELVHSEDTSQEEVFEESVAYLVDEALLGQNVAILCYGPTGSGKTYSMMGDPQPRTRRATASAATALASDEPAISSSPPSPATTTTTTTTTTTMVSGGFNESPATDALSETRVSSLTALDDNEEEEDTDDMDDMDDMDDGRAHTKRGTKPGPLPHGRTASGHLAKKGDKAASSTPADAADATLTATAENSGWVTVNRRHTHTTAPATGAHAVQRGPASSPVPVQTPAASRQLVNSEMGILPRLVGALLERLGETVVLRAGTGGGAHTPSTRTTLGTGTNDYGEGEGKGDDAEAPSRDLTPRKAPKTSAGASTASPPSNVRVTLSLEDIRMYGVELYLDEVFDLLSSKKQPVSQLGDTGGLAALCQSLDRANQRNQTGGGGGCAIRTMSDLRAVSRLARRNRVTGSHQRNDSSSRSHAVFILQLGFDLVMDAEDNSTNTTTHTTTASAAHGGDESHKAQPASRGRKAAAPVPASGPTRQRVHSFVAMVDLAGCERVKETQVAGTSLKEAQYINKSLSALSSVVLSLHRRSQHVPYRDSKLTRLLRPCLEGGRVLTLVHVAPCSSGDSMNALKFAHQIRHTMVKPHNYLSGANQDALQSIFEGLMDPAQGRLEEAVRKTQQEYEQLCAEVRVALFARAAQEPCLMLVKEGPGLLMTAASRAASTGGPGHRRSDRCLSGRTTMELSSQSRSSSSDCSSSSSTCDSRDHGSGSSTLNVSGEDDDVEGGGEAGSGLAGAVPSLSSLHRLLQASQPDARTDEARFMAPFTTELALPANATREVRRAFRIHTLASRDLASRMARDEAALRAAAREVHLDTRRAVEVHQRTILQKAEGLHAKLEDARQRHGRLVQERMSPVPSDPYAQELTAQLKSTNDGVAAASRERQQLMSLLAALRQRLALQDELETTADEEVAEWRGKLRHVGTAAAAAAAAAAGAAANNNNNGNSAQPVTPRRSGSGPESVGLTASYAALLDGPEDAELKDIHQLQVQTARDLASLRLETACFGMGEAIWEGLWARTMRQELHMAMWAERRLMEHVLLQDAALDIIVDSADTDAATAITTEAGGMIVEDNDTEAPASGSARLARSDLSPRKTRTPRRGSAVDAASKSAAAAVVVARQKALIRAFMHRRAEARQTHEAAASSSDGGELISPARATAAVPSDQPALSDAGPLHRGGGVRRTSRPTTALSTTPPPTSPPFSGPTLSTASTCTTTTNAALGEVMTSGSGLAALTAGQTPNPLTALVAAAQAYHRTPSRRASLPAGLHTSRSLTSSLESAVVQASGLASGPPSQPAVSTIAETPAAPEAGVPPALPAPISLVGTYGDELALQRASVLRLWEEGIPCEVCCLGDRFSTIWERFLNPSASSPVLAKAAATAATAAGRSSETTPLRLHGTSPSASTPPQSAAKRTHIEKEDDDDDDEGESLIGGESEGRANTIDDTGPTEEEAATATLMATQWGRLRLTRSSKAPHAFALEFVYLKEGGIPLPRNVTEALAAPLAQRKRDAREELLDSLPSSHDLRRGLTPPASSPAALRSPSEAVPSSERERRLFAIPLSEPELTLHAHVLEAGVATASPYWSTRRSRVRCRLDDTAQVALELQHVPITGDGGAAAKTGEDSAPTGPAQRSPLKTGKSGQTAASPPPSRGRRAIHVPSTQPPPAPSSATTTTVTASAADGGGQSPPGGRPHSLQSVTTESDALRKRAVRMRNVVLAKRLQGGSELLLPSSCILGNPTAEGACTLLLRFPTPHFSTCTRLENVETVVAALCGLLNPTHVPPPPPPSAARAGAPVLPSGSALRSPRHASTGSGSIPHHNLIVTSGRRSGSGNNSHTNGSGSGSGRLSARQRRSSEATAPATIAPPTPFALTTVHGRTTVQYTFAHIPRLLVDPHALDTTDTSGHGGGHGGGSGTPSGELGKTRPDHAETITLVDPLTPPSSMATGGGEAANSPARGGSVASSATARGLRGGTGALLSARPHEASGRRRSLPLSLAHPVNTSTHTTTATSVGSSALRTHGRSHQTYGPTAALAVTFYFPGSLPPTEVVMAAAAAATSPSAKVDDTREDSQSAALSVASASSAPLAVPPLTLTAVSSFGDVEAISLTPSLTSPSAGASGAAGGGVEGNHRERRRSILSASGAGASRHSRLRTPRASGMAAADASTSSAVSAPAPLSVTQGGDPTTSATAAGGPAVLPPAARTELYQIQQAAELVQQLRAVTVGGEALDGRPTTITTTTTTTPGPPRRTPTSTSTAAAAATAPRDALIARGLHQLQTFRRRVRAVVKQQTFDAEDIKDDFAGAFQVSEGESTAVVATPLAEVRQEALVTIGVQLPGVQLPVARADTSPLSSLPETAVMPARGDVSVAQGRELGSFSVPWTVWQWAYRWRQVSQCYTAVAQAQHRLYTMHGGGPAGEMLITTAIPAKSGNTTTTTTDAAATGAGRGTYWTLTEHLAGITPAAASAGGGGGGGNSPEGGVGGGSPLLRAPPLLPSTSDDDDDDDDFAYTFGRGRWSDEVAMGGVSAPAKTVWLPEIRFASVPAFLDMGPSAGPTASLSTSAEKANATPPSCARRL